MREAVGKLDQAVKDVERERQQLADLIGTARTQEEQRDWLWWTGGLAAVVALVIGLVGSPYLAGRLFWGGWQCLITLFVQSYRFCYIIPVAYPAHHRHLKLKTLIFDDPALGNKEFLT